MFDDVWKGSYPSTDAVELGSFYEKLVSGGMHCVDEPTGDAIVW